MCANEGDLSDIAIVGDHALFPAPFSIREGMSAAVEIEGHHPRASFRHGALAHRLRGGWVQGRAGQ
jgi:hypothetical protein